MISFFKTGDCRKFLNYLQYVTSLQHHIIQFFIIYCMHSFKRQKKAIEGHPLLLKWYKIILSRTLSASRTLQCCYLSLLHSSVAVSCVLFWDLKYHLLPLYFPVLRNCIIMSEKPAVRYESMQGYNYCTVCLTTDRILFFIKNIVRFCAKEQKNRASMSGFLFKKAE